MIRGLAAFALAAGTLVAGCSGLPVAPGEGGPADAATRSVAGGASASQGSGVLGFLRRASGGPVRSARLYGGDVTVQGPEGYCVDRRASRPAGGFAVMVACARTAGVDDADRPRLDALLTVQAGEAGSAMVEGSAPALVALLEGPGGAELLSDGLPVEVSGVEQASGIVFVSFSEPGSVGADAVAPPLWRAFLDVGDRLVTVSVRPLEGAALSSAGERRLIGEAVGALRAANT